MSAFLTGSCRFTNEGDQVVLDLVECIIVVYHKDMPLTGLAADISQLCHVNISNSNHKDAVAFGDTKKTALLSIK